MFEFLPTTIEGCYQIRPRVLADHRGTFSKLFHFNTFSEKGLVHQFSDVDYLSSPRNTLRGLHFHPDDGEYALLLTCASGSVLHVAVDLRKNSKTYGTVYSVTLESPTADTLYIPAGVAHGFLSVADDTTLLTLASHRTSVRSGIHWQSIDFDWPVANPVVSEEDQRLMTLSEYQRQS
ncbi:MAG TPA: dTDP-4-dehydrorhamnose 3,5-epimerase family protein [Cyclobacteriaceae bacterium]